MKHIKPLNETSALGNLSDKNTAEGMSYGQLERCMDYAKMIRERIEAGQKLDPWMHSQIAVAENELNSVHDALDAEDGIVESERDWNDKRRGPHPYTASLSDEDEKKKEAQMKKQAEMDDDDPEAYKEMPGSEEARKEGKVKTSKHVKSYHELYGDDEETNEAKVEVERYVRSHGKKPKGWGRWLFSYNRDGSNMFEIPTAMNWSDAQKWAKSKAKEDGKDYVYVMEAEEIIEGVMSNLHQLAGKVKDEAEFVKQFFKEYGDKVKKTADSIDWVKSLYQDTVDESIVNEGDDLEMLKLMNRAMKAMPGSAKQKAIIKDLNVLRSKNGLEPLRESFLNEEKAEGDRGPIDDEKIETALKKKEEETGVPMEFLRIVMRRGMAAWRTGHRPGATQQQWGYARVNSFLTKQEGTWGGADADVAKEVRDGGHDKKLKKA